MFQDRPTYLRNLKESQTAGQEPPNGFFIGGVHNGRSRSTASYYFISYAQAGEIVEVGGLKVE